MTRDHTDLLSTIVEMLDGWPGSPSQRRESARRIVLACAKEAEWLSDHADADPNRMCDNQAGWYDGLSYAAQHLKRQAE
jgi:hypothetical protein